VRQLGLASRRDSASEGQRNALDSGDNEITGTTVSDGDPSPHGVLGAEATHLFKDGWRWFYTQQHGDNSTFEVVPGSSTHEDD
jgi:hypothetical protein